VSAGLPVVGEEDSNQYAVVAVERILLAEESRAVPTLPEVQVDGHSAVVLVARPLDRAQIRHFHPQSSVDGSTKALFPGLFQLSCTFALILANLQGGVVDVISYIE
jgi:hypothetical protein